MWVCYDCGVEAGTFVVLYSNEKCNGQDSDLISGHEHFCLDVKHVHRITVETYAPFPTRVLQSSLSFPFSHLSTHIPTRRVYYVFMKFNQAAKVPSYC